ncbi:serine/threonine protein kinase [Kitasatospora sp. NPDC101183]|uniref:serine/threonine-protein kinase n=1 Tax=Kitasatospora sp. NPDC101183 TaxID=3364100 RepID=UPI0038286F22
MIGAGTVLDDRYRLTESLGRGGMGTVWRARDTRLERDVALKILNAGLMEETTSVERFRREARVVAAIGHPGIVGVHDYGEDDGSGAEGGERCAFIVMDLIEGRALSAVLRDEGRMPPERALALVADALDALHAVHQRAIVHRDIKPSNLLVRGDGAVFVADFGIALAIVDTKITRSGGFIGTAAYMSPEQAAYSSDAPVTPASDLYSMGVVCYELLTGRLPFDGGTVQMAVKHVHEPAPDLPVTFPAPVREFVAKALSKAPQDRHASAAEMAAAARTAVGLPVGEAGRRTVRLWKSPRALADAPTRGARTQDDSAPAAAVEPVVKVAPAGPTEPGGRRSRRHLLVPVIIPVVISVGTATAVLVDRNPFSSEAAPAGPSTAASAPQVAGGAATGTTTASTTEPAAPATTAATTAPGATPDAAQPQPQQPAPPAAQGGNGGGSGGGNNGGGTGTGQNSGTQARPPANNNPAPQPPPAQPASSGGGGSNSGGGGGNPPPQDSPPPGCGGATWVKIVNVQWGAPIGLTNNDPNTAGNVAVLGGASQYGWIANDGVYTEYNACNNNGAKLAQNMDGTVSLADYMSFLYRWVKTPAGSGAYTLAENGGARCLTAHGVGSPLTMEACTKDLKTQQWRIQS